MAIRQLLFSDSELLRKTSRPIETVDKRILTLLDDLAETLYEQEGAGLAAPQVGVLRRAIVIDVGDDYGLIQMVNPEIIASEGEQEEPEGCLSIPGKRGYVVRPQRVTVRGLNREGEPIEITAEGYLAIAFSHEIDHLDGILYTDKMTREYIPEDEDDEEEDEE